MSNGTFGEIISADIPILLMFFADTPQLGTNSPRAHIDLKDLAAHYGDKVKVVKIDQYKNTDLCDALRVSHNPTYIVYNSGKIIHKIATYTKISKLKSLLKPLL